MVNADLVGLASQLHSVESKRALDDVFIAVVHACKAQGVPVVEVISHEDDGIAGELMRIDNVADLAPILAGADVVTIGRFDFQSETGLSVARADLEELNIQANPEELAMLTITVHRVSTKLSYLVITDTLRDALPALSNVAMDDDAFEARESEAPELTEAESELVSELRTRPEAFRERAYAQMEEFVARKQFNKGELPTVMLCIDACGITDIPWSSDSAVYDAARELRNELREELQVKYQAAHKAAIEELAEGWGSWRQANANPRMSKALVKHYAESQGYEVTGPFVDELKVVIDLRH